jgi:hypothetical protein
VPHGAVQPDACWRTRWLHSLPHPILLQRKLSVRRFPQGTNSNNLLAVELERENDATENFSIDFFRVSFPLNAGSSRRQ